MALFGKKNKDVKKTEVVSDKESNPVKVRKSARVSRIESGAASHFSATSNIQNLTGVILRPRITEKATHMADTANVYVFEIAQNANKTTVSQAVNALYKVIPVKVSIARNPSKTIFRRGRAGVVSGVKKAYVYLKKNDKIEIV